jgi:hypothetical protein
LLRDQAFDVADIYGFELIQKFFSSLERLTFPVGTLWLIDLEDINGSSSMGCSENNVRIDAQLISYPDGVSEWPFTF